MAAVTIMLELQSICSPNSGYRRKLGNFPSININLRQRINKIISQSSFSLSCLCVTCSKTATLAVAVESHQQRCGLVDCLAVTDGSPRCSSPPYGPTTRVTCGDGGHGHSPVSRS